MMVAAIVGNNIILAQKIGRYYPHIMLMKVFASKPRQKTNISGRLSGLI
jgi:hypothetical protein